MNTYFLAVFYCLALTFSCKANAFDKVVLWGHKLHSHTHSYIHNGFYLAFNYLGYPTYWFDNQDDVEQFDFSNALFITEGQVDGEMPIRQDCQYMVHNVASNKYKELNPEAIIYFQVYTDDALNYPHLIKIDHCVYYDLPGRCLYMPWATDLLPFEIEEMKSRLSSIEVDKRVYWVGTIGAGLFGNIEQIAPFKKACEENGIDFVHKQGLDVKDNIELIRRSYMAPTIVGAWQASKGYIPCRIFKNISYGKMGVTNSYRVYELFDKKIVYHPDTYQLFYEAQKKMDSLTLEDIHELMDIVKNKHTYINRIQQLLDFFNRANQKEC